MAGKIPHLFRVKTKAAGRTYTWYYYGTEGTAYGGGMGISGGKPDIFKMWKSVKKAISKGYLIGNEQEFRTAWERFSKGFSWKTISIVEVQEPTETEKKIEKTKKSFALTKQTGFVTELTPVGKMVIIGGVIGAALLGYYLLKDK